MMKEALPYYLETTENDDAERQLRLGLYYYFGNMGLEKNLNEAVKWFRSAAENGNALAQMTLARLYVNGEGTEIDYENAAKWFSKSAEQKEPRGMYDLAICYIRGLGVEKNLDTAKKLLKEAARYGHKEARKLSYSLDHLNNWNIKY